MNSLSSSLRSLPKVRGFTLFEMMITMIVFLLLAASVFGILTGVLQGASTLQDNQNHHDQIVFLNAFLNKKLHEMPVWSSLASYRRGNGEGLLQNGIFLREDWTVIAIDAKIQSNGYYTLRLATFTPPNTASDSDAPPNTVAVPPPTTGLAFEKAVTEDNPAISWRFLMGDIRTLNWKFQDPTTYQWADTWVIPQKPNMIELSLQLAGDMQSATMDFWLPNITPVSLNVPPPDTSTNAH